jgi:hypothetical protein
MDRDDKVALLKAAVTEGEAASVQSGSSEGSEPSDVQPLPDDRTLPIGALATKLAAQEPSASEAPADPKQASGAAQVAAGVQTPPVPEIKVPPRDTLVEPAEPRRGRRLRLMVVACAVLFLGWLVGLNPPSVDLATTTAWVHQSADVLNATFRSVEKELENRFAQLTNWSASIAEASQTASSEGPNSTDALEQAAQALTIKLDQMQVSSEGATRDLRADVERLRAAVERSQAELTSKLAQVIERIERIEQQKASPPIAAAAQKPEQVAALSPTVPAPLPVQRPAPGADVKPTSPSPAPAARREPTVIKQWTVREVLNGMALLEGPRGLVGVSPGQTVPGVGRVESIIRQGSRWVVATSNGVITGREGPR